MRPQKGHYGFEPGDSVLGRRGEAGGARLALVCILSSTYRTEPLVFFAQEWVYVVKTNKNVKV